MAGSLIQPVNAPTFRSTPPPLTKHNPSLHFPVVKNLEWYGYGPTKIAPLGIWQRGFHFRYLPWYVGHMRIMGLTHAL
eukprot:scaffold5318_cov142-Skeletonema_marinoi.AAC.1